MAVNVKCLGTVIEVSFGSILLNQSCINTIHYSTLDQYLGNEAATIDIEFWRSAFSNPWLNNVLVSLPQPVLTRRLFYRAYNQWTWGATPANKVIDYTYAYNALTNSPGLRTPPVQNEVMPPFAAVRVQKSAVIQTKYSRGGFRLPGLYEGDQQDGILTAGLATSYKGNLDVLLSPVLVPDSGGATSTWRPVVLSSTYGFGPGIKISNVGQTNCTEIEEFLVSDEVTTQNSRKFGRGI